MSVAWDYLYEWETAIEVGAEHTAYVLEDDTLIEALKELEVLAGFYAFN